MPKVPESLEQICKDINIGEEKKRPLDTKPVDIAEKAKKLNFNAPTFFAVPQAKEPINVASDANKENLSVNASLAKKGWVLMARIGDWICQNCNNQNFSFRS